MEYRRRHQPGMNDEQQNNEKTVENEDENHGQCYFEQYGHPEYGGEG
jgi:hypothetical protein